MLVIKHRFEVIEKYVKGKDVLDIGCVGLGYQRGEGFWVHGKICEVAKKVVGVDIRKDEIAELRKREYEVIDADVNERLDLGEMFDVIHVGQVLTYLTDFDTFFDNVRRHLRPDGMLIISATNAHSLRNFVKYVFGGLGFAYTNFQNHISLRHLLNRCGFKVRQIEHVEEPSRRKSGKIYQWIFKPLPGRLSSHVIVIASSKMSHS